MLLCIWLSLFKVLAFMKKVGFDVDALSKDTRQKGKDKLDNGYQNEVAETDGVMQKG